MTTEYIAPFLNPLPHELTAGLGGPMKNVAFNQFFRAFGKIDDGRDLGRVFLHLDKEERRKVRRPVPRTNKRLSHRERRRLGLYSLGSKSVTYSQMLTVHNLWKDYMRELLQLDSCTNWKGNPTDPQFETISVKLQRADYHGAIITVIKSTCPSLVGVCGIVAMETKNCFSIIGEDNKLKRMPKKNSQFQFNLDSFNFNFYGKNLIVRPTERSNKKIKMIRPSCID